MNSLSDLYPLALLLISFVPLLSMIGLGTYILRLGLLGADQLGGNLECSGVSLTLGMAAYSQILFFAGAFGLFNKNLITVLWFSGLLALTITLYSHKPKIFPSVHNKAVWLMGTLLSLLSVFMLIVTYLNTSMIHGDARQYHLAFPWLMNLSGQLVTNSTILHNGTYIGYDILYLSIGDLTSLIDSPDLFDRLRFFNATTNILLPISVLMLCKAFGGTTFASTIAALAVFSLGPIIYWDSLKNDIFSSAVGITALSVLVRAHAKEHSRLLFVAAALAGFAVSVKITNSIPLSAPFLFVFLSQRFSKKTCSLAAAAGCLVLIPWMSHAFIASGSPFGATLDVGHFLNITHIPDEVQQAWNARDKNGLEPSWFNALIQFVPIMLGLYPIAGNQTVGLLSLLSLLVSIIFLIPVLTKRKIGLPEIIAATMLLWIFIFYAFKYDGRFLSRYIMICFFVLFSFAAFKTEVYLQRFSSKWKSFIAASATIIVMFFVAQNPSMTRMFVRLREFQGIEHLKKLKQNTLFEYSLPYVALENYRKQGEAVAINDHMLLLLKPPFVNLHGMHARQLNLYKKDTEFVKEYLSDHSVKYMLFRKHVTGETKAVSDYMIECAVKIYSFGIARRSRDLYRIRENCE